MFLPTISPPFPSTSAESEVLEAHPASDSAVHSGVPGRNTAAQVGGCVAGPSEADWSEENDRELAARYFDALQDPRFPDCHQYCAGATHVLGCRSKRQRPDDDFQRRSDYEEGIRE